MSLNDKIKGKNPLQLYLGVVPGIFPWLEEPLINEKMKKSHIGIIFSYWSFRKKQSQIISKGIHDFFSFDGPIMIDSGAYSAFNSNIEIQIDEYSNFILKIKESFRNNITVVNLDVIGDFDNSLKNFKTLKERIDYPILPVIHYPEKRIQKLSEKYVGVGGMVPSLKINQKGSVYDIASWITKLITSKEKKFHGFGIGSPLHQIAFNFLYSVDWIGWRRNAAFCSCYTPEGSIYIHEARKKKKKGKKLTSHMFERYAPPFIESYEQLYEPGTKGWLNRALWNVWWFLIASENQNQIECNKYVKNLQKRITQA